MKERIRALVRIGHARKRLRDLASAELTLADEARLQAELSLRQAQHRFRQMLVDGALRFEMSPASRTLVQFDEERLRAVAGVTDAEVIVRSATAVCEERRKVVRIRERELRTAEKLLEHARDEWAELERRVERHVIDDLVATRALRLATEEGA